MTFPPATLKIELVEPLDNLTVFEAVKKDSIAAQVARQIRRRILNDQILPGSRLPPERELAAQFQTNRNTLREALRLLEVEGLIRVRQGGGMEVLDYRKSGGIHLLVHYLNDVEDPQKRLAFLSDAIALRREAMALVARLAAVNRTEEGLKDLKQAFTRLQEAISSGHGVAEADIAFHRAMGHATQSLVVAWLTNTLAEAFERVSKAIWVTEPEYLSHMEKVLEAIIRKDPEGAAAAILAHYEASDSLLIEHLKGDIYSNSKGSGGAYANN